MNNETSCFILTTFLLVGGTGMDEGCVECLVWAAK